MKFNEIQTTAFVLDAKQQIQIKGGTDDVNTADYIGGVDIDVF